MEGSLQPTVNTSLQQNYPTEVKLKLVLLGDLGSGKTSLVNSVKVKPLRPSGAEAIAGYCIYNERMPITLTIGSSTSDVEDDAAPQEETTHAVTVRLQMTEVRKYSSYGTHILCEAVKQNQLPALFILCIDLTNPLSLTSAAPYLRDVRTLSQSSQVGPFRTMVVGTKSDLTSERIHSYEECLSFAGTFRDAMYCETANGRVENFRNILTMTISEIIEENIS